MNLLEKVRIEIGLYKEECMRAPSGTPIPSRVPFQYGGLDKMEIKKPQNVWEFEIFALPKDSVVQIKGHIVDGVKKLGEMCLHFVKFYNFTFEEDLFLLLENTSDNATIVFKQCSFMGKLKIRNSEEGTYAEQQQSKARLEKLEFIDCQIVKGSETSAPYIRVGYLDVKHFVLSNLRIPYNAEVNIGDCRFRNFRLSNMRNLGKCKIYKINALPQEKCGNAVFQIDNTSIGDADFQSVDLSAFSSIVAFDNILHGLKYTNVSWGDHVKNEVQVGQYFGDEEEKIIKMRDTYRVLKDVALKNNDTDPAFAFYAKEMKFHSQLVRNYARFFYQERIILELNWLTNNFGQSWLRPIGWIAGTGAIFYIALLISLCLNPCDFANWEKFWVFLNPTHKVKFIAQDSWEGWAYALDFLYRPIEGALIYQAIQAFRRYSRKF